MLGRYLTHHIIIASFVLLSTVAGCGGGGGNTPSGNLATPSSVTATPGTEKITISWNPVSGATSYNIYWASSPGSSKSSSVVTTTNTSYPHENRTNGQTYYYVVTAVHNANESDISAEVSATPKIGLSWSIRKDVIKADLYSFAWSGSRFVGVSNNGTILTSSDGSAWDEIDPIINSNDGLSGIAWSGARFVAVGGALLTSEDGLSWTSRSYPISADRLVDVTWNGALFVSVGLNGSIVTSPDGISWNVRNSPNTGQSFWKVRWLGSRFVAIGSTIGSAVLASTDGSSWSNDVNNDLSGVSDIVSSGSDLIAVRLDGAILRSSDSTTWTPVNSGTTESLMGVAWTGSQFVAVSYSNSVLRSPDGISWTTQSLAGGNGLRGILWNGSRLLTYGEIGAIYSSTDAINWNLHRSSAPLTRLIVNGGQYITVGSYGTVLTSTNGRDWVLRNMFPKGYHLKDILWDGGRYIISASVTHTPGGDSPPWNEVVVFSSPDLVNWNELSKPSPAMYGASIAWSGSAYTGSFDGDLYSSPDAMTWTYQANGSFGRVRWLDSQFLAVGGNGSINSSPDGLTWTSHNVESIISLHDVASSGSVYIAVGSSATWGHLVYSTDGSNWTSYPFDVGFASSLSGVTWTGSEFVVTGSVVYGMAYDQTMDIVMTSSDGLSWVIAGLDRFNGLLDVVSTANQYVMISNNGVILSSP